ncbi:MAG: mandelate racemase/muconate lactonizing enzyme family protein [Synergistetes bacterium]|nr:mandelate racemase/muconate lactonizing enzyme family protein [Synergistota bacterium]
MRITEVKFIPLKCKLPKPIKFSLGVLTHRNFALVKVETDAGISGWGEAFVNFPSWAIYERKATIEYGLKPLLIGENPLDPEGLTHRVMSRLYRLGLQWGARGCIYQAISAINIALWDIKGKVEDKPLYKLLGGEKDKVLLYAIGMDMSDLESSLTMCLKLGFKALKIRVGFDKEEDVILVKKARSIVGKDVKVYVDANQGWESEEAYEMVLRVEEAGADWIEEPTLCEDLKTMSEIAERLTIPLAAGENYFGISDFRKALDLKAIDIGMPDITRVGSIGEMRKVCDLLKERGLPYSPHFYGSDVGFAATLHFACAVPNRLEVPRDVSLTPLREEVLRTPLEIVDGYAIPPDGPGLGIDVNEEALNKYAF